MQLKDEYFYKSPAANFKILEQGDNFPLGEGYVRWFTEGELKRELEDTSFELISFENDENYQGTGYIRLIELKKPV